MAADGVPMTAASPAPLALLLSCNDLEALAAADLAARHGVAVHDLALNWGERPDAVLDRIDIDRLPQAVILVELPGRLEERLRQTGRTVYRIDHHSYVDPVTRRLDDRSSPLSSLEQVAAPGTVAPLIADALSLRTAIAAIAAGQAPRPVPLLCLSMPAGNPTADPNAEANAEPASLFWSGGGEDWPLVREWMAALADPENPAVPARHWRRRCSAATR